MMSYTRCGGGRSDGARPVLRIVLRVVLRVVLRIVNRRRIAPGLLSFVALRAIVARRIAMVVDIGMVIFSTSPQFKLDRFGN